MVEYIEKEKAIAYVEEQYRLFKGDENKQAIVDGCVEALKFTPTADVEEVRHGEWIDSDPAKWQCSECNYRVERWNSTPYCPNCGAKMDGGKI